MVAAVVWVSLTPSPPKVDFAQSDKLGHFIVYGALMLWFAQLYLGRTRLLYAAGFIAMGIGLEFVQGWLNYRIFDSVDIYANVLGVFLGWSVALICPRVLP